MRTRILVASILVALASFGASAQTTADTVQRDVNQQTRIEQGVKSGELTKRETGKLEAGQVRVDHAEAATGSDGRISKNEQARVQR